jgi:hypothetical protein
MKVHLNAHVSLLNNTLFLNGDVVVAQQPSASELFTAAYHQLNISYPKFFKMDNLSKTGFIAAELLLKENNSQSSYTPEQKGIVLSSRNSSLDTDIRYNTSTATNPSPSLFVYTLPNVLIGELCIKNVIKGETACFVFDTFDADFQTDYVNLLYETGNLKTCISGWADFFDEKAEAFIYLTELRESSNETLHNAENIKNIYSKIWKN